VQKIFCTAANRGHMAGKNGWGLMDSMQCRMKIRDVAVSKKQF